MELPRASRPGSWLGLCAVWLAAAAAAQPPYQGEPTSPGGGPLLAAADGRPLPAHDAIASRRQEVSDELRVARRLLQAADDQPQQPPPEPLSREVELLKQIDTVLAQLASASDAHQELESRLSALQAQEAPTAEAGEADQPASFLELDNLRDELATHQGRSDLITAAVTAATTAVETARASCEEKQRALRLLKEAQAAPGVETSPAAVKEAELAVRLCTETLALRRQQLENEKLTAEIHRLETQQLQRRIERMAGQVRFDNDQLQEKLAELDKQEADLQRTRASLELDLTYAERQFFDARQRLDTDPDAAPAVAEQMESKRLARQLLQQQIESLNRRLEQLSTDRDAWKRRHAVINETASTEELIQWREEAAGQLSQLQRERRIQQQRVEELRNESAKRDQRLQGENLPDEQRRWVQEQQSTLQQQIQVFDRMLASMSVSERLHAKLQGEIEGDVQRWTLAEWLATAGHYIAQLWNTELTQVDDRPITIGKVALGMLLIFCGLVMSRMLSRLLGGRLSRFGMDQGGVSALQSVAFYVLLVVFTLTSLRFVNVPLTVFTLLGGAIAIGVGFGSQNILNNFISGLILLAERPIKVGDLIQLEDLFGNVVKIGARSTQIRTGENLDIIVPNSKFLENNVINLTLGDDKLRTKVNVGVIYGSPTREVARLLERAADEHGQVLRSPRPFVWFVDFGDNSLNFQIHFWVKARTLAERTRIESDIRYRIDQLFREAGIVIAFPQRDVHLDSIGPVDIRLLSADASPERGAA